MPHQALLRGVLPSWCSSCANYHSLFSREKLQNCPKVQAANFDLDGLCSELKQKAKCTGHSLEVKDQEFQSVLNKYLGEDFTKKCGGEKKTAGQTA